MIYFIRRFFFPNICYGNLVELLKVDLTVLWEPPLGPPCLGVFPGESPAVCQLQFRFSSPGVEALVTVAVSVLWVPAPCLCLSLQSRRHWFASCPPSAAYGRRVVYFSFCSTFYLLDGVLTSKLGTWGIRNWKPSAPAWEWRAGGAEACTGRMMFYVTCWICDGGTSEWRWPVPTCVRGLSPKAQVWE